MKTRLKRRCDSALTALLGVLAEIASNMISSVAKSADMGLEPVRSSKIIKLAKGLNKACNFMRYALPAGKSVASALKLANESVNAISRLSRGGTKLSILGLVGPALSTINSIRKLVNVVSGKDQHSSFDSADALKRYNKRLNKIMRHDSALRVYRKHMDLDAKAMLVSARNSLASEIGKLIDGIKAGQKKLPKDAQKKLDKPIKMLMKVQSKIKVDEPSKLQKALAVAIPILEKAMPYIKKYAPMLGPVGVIAAGVLGWALSAKKVISFIKSLKEKSK